MTSDRRSPLPSHDNALASRSPSRRSREQPITGPNGRQHAPQRTIPLEVAGYIEILTAELRMMAHTADLDSLAYFLEMARLEAAIQVQRLAQRMPEQSG